jgi:hypothetical protein
VEDLWGKGHPPDTLVAAAIAYSLRVKQGARGHVTSITKFAPGARPDKAALSKVPFNPDFWTPEAEAVDLDTRIRAIRLQKSKTRANAKIV